MKLALTALVLTLSLGLATARAEPSFADGRRGAARRYRIAGSVLTILGATGVAAAFVSVASMSALCGGDTTGRCVVAPLAISLVSGLLGAAELAVGVPLLFIGKNLEGASVVGGAMRFAF